MNLIDAVRSAMSLRTFIAQDIVSHLVSIELNAAANALRGIDRAVDKNSVYWSAINHLEVVEEVLKGRLRKVGRFKAVEQCNYIIALKAAIYKYLGEDGLVIKCYEDTMNTIKTYSYYDDKNSIKDGFASWNPLVWVRLYKDLNSSFGKEASMFDVNEFWKLIADKDVGFHFIYVEPDTTPY